MKIIIGLGNPGLQYENTRHNAGFLLLDHLAKERDLRWESNKKFHALIAKDGDTLYVKPQTFMNESGHSVAATLSYYKLLPKKLGILRTKNADLSEILTVAHDDIDIPLSKFKISIDSRSAGHRGVDSIIRMLGTKNFRRIRIGILDEGKKNIPALKQVLGKFSPEEKKIIDRVIEKINI